MANEEIETSGAKGKKRRLAEMERSNVKLR